MKNFIILLTSFLSLPFHAFASNDWRAFIQCNNRAAVIDRGVKVDSRGNEVTRYQLVIRDSETIKYFVAKSEGLAKQWLNRNGEFTLIVERQLGERVFANASTPQLEFSLDDRGGARINLYKFNYYGRTRTELGHWYFDRCQ